MDLDLKRIRYFVAVAEQLSFARAAAELHITQPALSRQIQALERELGTPLLVRDRRGIAALTGPGRQLLEDAQALLSAGAALERRVRAAAKSPTMFTIGFMPGVPSTEIVAKFVAEEPELSIDVVYVPMDDQEPYLLDGRVDVSFVRLPLRSAGLEAIPLFPEPRVALVPAGLHQVVAPALRLEELRPLALLDEPTSLPGWRGERVLRRRPLLHVEERVEAVAAGAGFCVLPEGIARYHHRTDIAVVVLTDVPPVTVALGYSSHRTMPAIDSFARLARQHLGAGS
ncbi:LysR family transcriptional regulator [Pseudonocardia sp. WMMC193]|uniref:LysR family transcriptional regulator n=1 Tax=Pseudonocardia sp. WMMC193 TaxID=2911965 RepID=UPI001F018BF0|nr:LysR family transcriptional regulator [Pseudonocardia sp. WMMC193]MCF7552309.1 LysR family transcriptional regulator [Pseudonocardia sp. WMMC193]